VWAIFGYQCFSVPICYSIFSIVHGVKLDQWKFMNWGGGGGFLVQQIASFESSSSHKVRIFLSNICPLADMVFMQSPFGPIQESFFKFFYIMFK
jgi:hypothetical protein